MLSTMDTSGARSTARTCLPPGYNNFKNLFWSQFNILYSHPNLSQICKRGSSQSDNWFGLQKPHIEARFFSYIAIKITICWYRWLPGWQRPTEELPGPGAQPRSVPQEQGSCHLAQNLPCPTTRLKLTKNNRLFDLPQCRQGLHDITKICSQYLWWLSNL